MSFYESLMWFFAGAIFYKAISYLLAIGNSYVIFEKYETSILTMLRAASNDLEYSFELKYHNLKSAGMKEEEIKKMQLADAVVIVRWREALVFSMIKSMPKYFQKFVQYTNWEEACKVLEQRTEDRKSERE